MYSVSVIGLLLAFFEFGIAILSTKVISAKGKIVTQFIQSAFGLRILSYFAAILTLLLLYKFSDLLKHQLIVFSLLVFGISNSLTVFFRSVFRGYEVMKLEGISIVVDRFLVITICSISLIVSPSLNVFIICYSSAFLLSMIVTFFLFFQHVPNPIPSFNLSSINNLVLKPGYVFAVMNILLIMRKSFPSLLIEGITDSVQVGYFNSGFRLLESYLLIPAIFITPIYPLFVRLHSKTRILTKLITNSSRLILLITSFLVIPIFFFRDQFTLLLYGSEFIEASNTIGILIISMFAMGLTVIFGSLVSASDRQKAANKIIIFEVLLGIIIFSVSINSLAAEGAAIATVIMEILMAGLLIFVSKDMIHVSTILKLILKFILVSVLAYSLLYFIYFYFGYGTLFLDLFIGIGVVALSNRLIGTISNKDIIKLLSFFKKKIRRI